MNVMASFLLYKHGMIREKHFLRAQLISPVIDSGYALMAGDCDKQSRLIY